MSPAEIAAALLNRESELTEWEREFVRRLSSTSINTEKQRAKLIQIWQRVSRSGDETDPLAEVASQWVCQDCGNATHYWNGATVEDGRPLCPQCRWARITRGAREDTCGEPGCRKTAREHIEEFRAITQRASWIERFESRRKPVVPEELT